MSEFGEIEEELLELESEEDITKIIKKTGTAEEKLELEQWFKKLKEESLVERSKRIKKVLKKVAIIGVSTFTLISLLIFLGFTISEIHKAIVHHNSLQKNSDTVFLI